MLQIFFVEYQKNWREIMISYSLVVLNDVYNKAKYQLSQGQIRKLFDVVGTQNKSAFIPGMFNEFIAKRGYGEFYRQFNLETEFTGEEDYFNSVFKPDFALSKTRLNKLKLLHIFSVLPDVKQFITYYNVKGEVKDYKQFVGLINVLSKITSGEVFVFGRFLSDEMWDSYYKQFIKFCKDNKFKEDDVIKSILNIKEFGLDDYLANNPNDAIVNFVNNSGLFDMVGELDVFAEKYFLYLKRITEGAVGAIKKPRGGFFYVDVFMDNIKPMEVKKGARGIIEKLAQYVIKNIKAG